MSRGRTAVVGAVFVASVIAAAEVAKLGLAEVDVTP